MLYIDVLHFCLHDGCILLMGLFNFSTAFVAPCELRGCKNGPDPFSGRMSYKASKPGLAVCHILACFLCCCLLGPLFMYC